MNITYYDILNPCEQRPENRTAAAALAILAALLATLGMSFLKRSKKAGRPWFAWLFGCLLISCSVSRAAAEGACFADAKQLATHYATYTFAPEIFVAPLLAITNVFNVLLAKCLNNEHVDADIVMYTALVSLGCALTGIAGGTPKALCALR